MIQSKTTNFANIPAELRAHPQWVNWRLESRDGGESTKVPYQPNGQRASSTDAATWSTFDDATAVAHRFSGIGFVFSKDDSYVGLDLDDCRDAATGFVEPWAVAIVDKLASYTEVSPSGTGLKLFCRGELPGNGTGKKAKYETGAVEAYQHGRYFTVTGEVYGEPRPIVDCSEAIGDIWRQVFGDAVTTETKAVVADPPSSATAEVVAEFVPRLLALPKSIEGENGSDDSVHAGCEIRRAGIYGDAGRKLLDLYNEHRCEPLWESWELDRIWMAARKRVAPAGSEFDVVEDAEVAQVVGAIRRGGISYRRITSAELASGDYRTEYLIDGALAAGQPLIIAGPQKSLKTSFIIDAAISLAVGGYFLGRLRVNRQCVVAVMTGESGLATIQETANRICSAAGKKLAAIDNLIWSPDLPQFGNEAHMAALETFLEADGVEVLAIDPAYLVMPGADAGNLFIQGALLRSVSELCQRLGVTMLLAHHTKKRPGRDAFQPLELNDIAWAGFQEFARQWWLIGRRERYVEGSGEHRMWLSIGGSAGHTSLWGVDVTEGVRTEDTPRTWKVETYSQSQTRAEDTNRRAVDNLDGDAQKVFDAMKAQGKAMTISEIRDRARVRSMERARDAVDWLVETGSARPANVVRANKQTYEGYELKTQSDAEAVNA